MAVDRPVGCVVLLLAGDATTVADQPPEGLPQQQLDILFCADPVLQQGLLGLYLLRQRAMPADRCFTMLTGLGWWDKGPHRSSPLHHWFTNINTQLRQRGDAVIQFRNVWDVEDESDTGSMKFGHQPRLWVAADEQQLDALERQRLTDTHLRVEGMLRKAKTGLQQLQVRV